MDTFITQGKRVKVRDLAWLLIPFSLFALVILFLPFRFVFELDRDEGVNLIKSVLITQGDDLYSDIWSDQPPIFTLLIAVWLRILGVNLTATRILILLMSCTLLWAAVQYLRAFWGPAHALAGGLTIVLLSSFLRLSMSIMVGLPAIMLAMLSFLTISYWHKERRKFWLILSALALGLSVMTKLFTGFLVPVFLVGLILQEWQAFSRKRSWRVLLTPGAIWLGGFGFTSLLVWLFFIYPDGTVQLLDTHLIAAISSPIDTITIAGYLRESLPAVVLGVIGSFLVIRNRRWTGIYLIAWALVSYLLLSQHSPIWYHHQLLVTIPIAVLCGIAVGEFVVALADATRKSQFGSVRGASFGIVAFLILYLLIARAPRVFSQLDYRLPNFKPPEAGATTIQAVQMLEVMREYEDVTNTLITDRPMLAVWLGKPVPPYLAAATGKRITTGELSEHDIISAIRRYRPEQVALGRFELPAVDAYLQQNYTLVYKLTDHRLYVRGDL
jgi:4-amino-4-deoxy-L-arabinose transferase-like glycosyltransferase